jgi:glyoxylase-like metal-dependent hydrolase (beta-lactamase superfamily II)
MRRMAIAFLMSLATAGASAQSFDITQVAPGVYAAIGRAGVASNGAFIVNQDDVLVVDTHYRPSWARDLIAEIKKVTDKPVRYVVSSHWHNDHTQGNQSYVTVFGNTVEYLAQHTAREDLITQGIPSVKESLERGVPDAIARLEKMLSSGMDQQNKPLTAEQRERLQTQLASQKAYLEELKTIQITLPTLTFERSLILHKKAGDGSDRAIHIYHFGRGHTRGDVVVYLPKEKVVVTGDLLTGGVPFARDAYPFEWVGTLESIGRLDFAQVIPGHGGVQPGKQRLEFLIALMKDVVSYVKDAAARGQAPEQIQKDIDLTRHDANFPNLRQSLTLLIARTHAQATGKLPD